VIVLLASLIFLQGRIGPLRLAWDWPEVRRLLAIGSPLLAAGVASSLFRSLDKLMILAYLDDGEFQLGCYSLALMVTTQLYGLANMLSAVMGPRYMELLGRSGCPSDVARLAARTTEGLAAALALPAALALAAGPPVLHWMLPSYRPGLEPLWWLVPGTLAVALALPASGYLVAVNRGRTVLGVLVASILVSAAGNHLALTHGGGLRGVALATFVGDVLYLVLLIGASLWPQLTLCDRRRYLLGLSMGLVPIVALAAVLQAIQMPRAGPLTAISVSSFMLALWGAAVWIGWTHGDWKRNWRS
jgi:O-antigen/teichoic acid export membrane protein